MNTHFFFNAFLAVLLGLFIGLERSSKTRSFEIQNYILVALSSFIFTYLAWETFGQQTSISIITAMILLVALLSLGIILRAKYFQEAASIVMSMLLLCGIGILIGSNLRSFAIYITFLFLFLMLIVRTVQKLTLGYRKNLFSLTIEIKKLSSLDIVEKYLDLFRFDLLKKQIVKSDQIYLEIEYLAHKLAQRLFLRRLYKLKGLGQIIRLDQ